MFPSGDTTLDAVLNSVLSVADVVNSKQVVRNLDIHSKVLAVHALRYDNNNTKLLYKLSIEKELSIGSINYGLVSLLRLNGATIKNGHYTASIDSINSRSTINFV